MVPMTMTLPLPLGASTAFAPFLCFPRARLNFSKLVDLALALGAVCEMLCGMHFGIGFAYGFLFLERELGASGVQLGLSLTAQALLEVPLFQVANPLVNALGMRNALLVCQLAAAIRFLGYVSVHSPWWVLPFEVGHGFSFAVVYTSMSLLAEEFAPVGLQATVLGVATSAQTAGALIATLGWSELISVAGMRAAFAAAVALFAIASTPLLLTLPIDHGPTCRRAWSRLLRSDGRLLTRAVGRSDDAVAHGGSDGGSELTQAHEAVLGGVASTTTSSTSTSSAMGGKEYSPRV